MYNEILKYLPRIRIRIINKAKYNRKKETVHLKFYEEFHVALQMIDEKIMHCISLMSS